MICECRCTTLDACIVCDHVFRTSYKRCLIICQYYLEHIYWIWFDGAVVCWKPTYTFLSWQMFVVSLQNYFEYHLGLQVIKHNISSSILFLCVSFETFLRVICFHLLFVLNLKDLQFEFYNFEKHNHSV